MVWVLNLLSLIVNLNMSSQDVVRSLEKSMSDLWSGDVDWGWAGADPSVGVGGIVLPSLGKVSVDHMCVATPVDGDGSISLGPVVSDSVDVGRLASGSSLPVSCELSVDSFPCSSDGSRLVLKVDL